MMLRKRRRCEDSDSDSDGEEEAERVKVVGTNVYFYTGVDIESVLELNQKLKTLELELLKKAIEYPGYSPCIKLFINSGGGDIFAGFSAMDHIMKSNIDIHTIADGQCASAATFMLLGGTHRSINAHAHVLIHQISSGFWGKFEEMKDEVKSCERFMEMVNKVYKDNTDIPTKKLKVLMKRDVYLTPDECIEYSIVNDIF